MSESDESVKKQIVKALDLVGGVDYLVRMAEKQPRTFMTLIGKVIPSETNVKISGKIEKIEVIRRDSRQVLQIGNDLEVIEHSLGDIKD